MAPTKTNEVVQRGWIIPIGGAEDKLQRRRILSRFVSLSGGSEARIVIIPTASRLTTTGDRYLRLFTELGAKDVQVADILTRDDAEREDYLQMIENATGVFLTGGNQLRITTIIGGTSAAKAIRRGNAKGLNVAGTSAGASVLSDHMIAFGKDGSSPRAGAVRLAPGLGLTNRFIIDQHFRQRDRLGRLISALAFNPHPTGIGLDEDTAAFIGPDNTLEVEGSGALTLVDSSKTQFSSMAEAGVSDPICVLGITVHILAKGATYNLHTRTASPGTLDVERTLE
jgi:cyanophycinase